MGAVGKQCDLYTQTAGRLVTNTAKGEANPHNLDWTHQYVHTMVGR